MSLFHQSLTVSKTTCVSRLSLLLIGGALLLASAGSLAAATYTWDPGLTTTGSDGSGTWSASAANANFANGGTDTTAPTDGLATVRFGSAMTTGAAGTVEVVSAQNVGVLRLAPTNDGNTYTFNTNSTDAGSITASTLNLNVGGTFNVPLTVTSVNFTTGGNTLTLSGGSNAFGSTQSSIGASAANGPTDTILLTAGTYTLGNTATGSTGIAVGNAVGDTAGMQVNPGATLTSSNNILAGGFTGTGLLTINGGSLSISSANVLYVGYMNAPSSTGSTAANLAGGMIVNSGSTVTSAAQMIVGYGFGDATQSAHLDVNGGTVTLSGTTSITGSILLNDATTAAAGSATFNLNGGTVTTGTAGGIVMNAGTTTVGSSTFNMTGGTLSLGTNGISNGTASGDATNVTVSGGSLTSTGKIIVGGNFSSATQTATFNMNGGTVALSGTTPAARDILLNDVSTAAGSATFNMNGGTVTTATVGGITLNAGATTAGSSTLNVTGGTLSLGSDGISLGSGTGATANINLSGGTIGATAAWKTSLPMTLTTGANGNVTFQTADASGTANNITLNGALSGSGGLIKTGAGILSLGMTNTYSGATLVNAGTLTLTATGSIKAASVDTVTVTGSTNSSGTAVSGTLSLSSTAGVFRSDNIVLQVASGGYVTLALGNNATTETVYELALNGTYVAAGTYTSTQLNTLSATNGLTYTPFSGIGKIVVTQVPEPGATVFVSVALAGLALAHRRSRRPTGRQVMPRMFCGATDAGCGWREDGRFSHARNSQPATANTEIPFRRCLERPAGKQGSSIRACGHR